MCKNITHLATDITAVILFVEMASQKRLYNVLLGAAEIFTASTPVKIMYSITYILAELKNN